MYDTGVLIEEEPSNKSQEQSNENQSKTSETGPDNSSQPLGWVVFFLSFHLLNL